MDVPLYDVYLTGKLAEAVSREQASERLAQIFKNNPATMLGLLTGKAQILKRGVDKNTAVKYRDALQQAGVEVAFKAQTNAPEQIPLVKTAAPPTAAKPAAQPATASAATMASANPATVATAQPTASARANSNLSLAPAGSEVLTAEERPQVAATVIDLSHLSIADLGPLTDGTQHHAAIAPPPIDHLSLAAAGSDLLSADERAQIPVAAPDTSELSLAPAGSELETLSSALPPVQVDISELSIAPSGADLLPPEQRRKTDAVAPNTDHIKLA